MASTTELVSEALSGRASAVSALDDAVDRARVAGNAALNELLDPLAAEAAGGHDGAVGLLVGLIDNHRLCRPGVRRVLLSQHQIEEAEQLALIAVFRYIHTFEGRARFTTWLFTVAKNEAGRVLSGDTKYEHDELEDNPEVPIGLRRMSSIAATQASLAPVLHSIIASLPDELAETLRLREDEGLSYEAIAERMSVGMGTVKSRLHRARQWCVEALQGTDFDPGHGRVD